MVNVNLPVYGIDFAVTAFQSGTGLCPVFLDPVAFGRHQPGTESLAPDSVRNRSNRNDRNFGGWDWNRAYRAITWNPGIYMKIAKLQEKLQLS